MKTTVMLSVLLLFVPGSVHPECVPSIGTAEIKVDGRVQEMRVRHDLPLSEIRVLEKEKEYANAHQTLGFTSYETRNAASFTVEYAGSGRNGKPGCAWIKDIRASLDVTLVDIFLPLEYGEGTCEYIQVREHEEEHVRILKLTHAEYLEILKKILSTPGALPDASAPVEAVSADDAKKKVGDNLQRILDDFMKDFSSTLSGRQQSVDTPENYAVISARCSPWKSE